MALTDDDDCLFLEHMEHNILPPAPKSTKSFVLLGFPTNNLYTFIASPMHGRSPEHLTLLCLITLTIS